MMKALFMILSFLATAITEGMAPRVQSPCVVDPTVQPNIVQTEHQCINRFAKLYPVKNEKAPMDIPAMYTNCASPLEQENSLYRLSSKISIGLLLTCCLSLSTPGKWVLHPPPSHFCLCPIYFQKLGTINF